MYVRTHARSHFYVCKWSVVQGAPSVLTLAVDRVLLLARRSRIHCKCCWLESVGTAAAAGLPPSLFSNHQQCYCLVISQCHLVIGRNKRFDGNYFGNVCWKTAVRRSRPIWGDNLITIVNFSVIIQVKQTPSWLLCQFWNHFSWFRETWSIIALTTKANNLSCNFSQYGRPSVFQLSHPASRLKL